ncbi:MAG: ABC transporter ATP-binding protein [Chloroflexi bacterium]|nr:ABC transporter ATP-binding protein [Chloroflexota bacterium]
MLDIHDLSTYYGPIRALKGVALNVQHGEIVALIGANGAGKTTLLNTIAGLLKPRQGQILYQGRNIAGDPPEAIVRAGISLVPERRQIFSTLSVRDNLLLGAYARASSDGNAVEVDVAQMYALFPVLEQRKSQMGGTLSGGEQQMLAIARGLMSRPKLLLLDEPSVGLAPLIVREILRIVADLRTRGTTIMLVEQNARAALQVADRGYVLENGQIALEGSAEELVRNANVQKAYLGRQGEREKGRGRDA